MSCNQPNQISLPESIYKMYTLFEKISDPKWDENPFRDYKVISGIKIKLAKNLSNLNYFTIDIPFNNKLNPKFILQYIKNIKYRNCFSDSLRFRIIKEINEHQWKEDEIYLGHKTSFDVQIFKFQLLFYNTNNDINTNISQAKYYNAYKILKSDDGFILRFELVLNNLDIDQDIDLMVYLNMLLNILKATYDRFNLKFDVIPDKIDRPRSSSLDRLSNININQNKLVNRPKSAENKKKTNGTQTE